MKKTVCILIAICLVCLCAVSFAACNNKTFTMSFFVDGEELLPSIQGKAGSEITVPDVPEKEDMVFDGWYLNPEFSGKAVQIPSKMPKNDVTYYARFVPAVRATYLVFSDSHENFDTRLNNTLVAFKNMLLANGCTAKSDVTKTLNSEGNIIINVNVYVTDSEQVDNIANVLKQVARSAKLEFKAENSADAQSLLVGSEHLKSATVTKDGNDNYAIGLQFNDEGTARFAEITAEYLNRTLYIFIDGEMYTQVIVNAQITNGYAVISAAGGYTYDNALEMASKLQAGTFGVSLRLLEMTSING